MRWYLLLSCLAACGARTGLEAAADAPAADVARVGAPCACSVCRASCVGTSAGCAVGELCQSGRCLRRCTPSGCARCVTRLDCDTPIEACE